VTTTTPVSPNLAINCVHTNNLLWATIQSMKLKIQIVTKNLIRIIENNSKNLFFYSITHITLKTRVVTHPGTSDNCRWLTSEHVSDCGQPPHHTRPQSIFVLCTSTYITCNIYNTLVYTTAHVTVCYTTIIIIIWRCVSARVRGTPSVRGERVRGLVK